MVILMMMMEGCSISNQYRTETVQHIIIATADLPTSSWIDCRAPQALQ